MIEKESWEIKLSDWKPETIEEKTRRFILRLFEENLTIIIRGADDARLFLRDRKTRKEAPLSLDMLTEDERAQWQERWRKERELAFSDVIKNVKVQIKGEE